MKQKLPANKIHKGYRLDPEIVRAIQKTAKEHRETESWVVEKILGIALGVLPQPKPLPINSKIEIA